MLLYQVLLCLDTYDTDAIAINKLCKLNFRLPCTQLYVSSMVIRAFLNMVFTFFETLVY